MPLLVCFTLLRLAKPGLLLLDNTWFCWFCSGTLRPLRGAIRLRWGSHRPGEVGRNSWLWRAWVPTQCRFFMGWTPHKRKFLRLSPLFGFSILKTKPKKGAPSKNDTPQWLPESKESSRPPQMMDSTGLMALSWHQCNGQASASTLRTEKEMSLACSKDSERQPNHCVASNGSEGPIFR